MIERRPLVQVEHDLSWVVLGYRHALVDEMVLGKGRELLEEMIYFYLLEVELLDDVFFL